MSHPSAPTGVVLLGATGSIGASTLRLLADAPDRFRLVAATGHRNDAGMAELCARFGPERVAMADPSAARRLRERLAASGGPAPAVDEGPEALETLAAHPEADLVVAAVVGAAGLAGSLAAARAGKQLLLANKEALVMAGPVFLDAVRGSGARLLPIDSEHNAIFQCLAARTGNGPAFAAGIDPLPGDVRRLLLTASGGPFRTADPARLADVTPDQACAHPNWEMGRKISVDSATMMNKGLELIEACLLFGAPPDRVEIVVHPQSIVHSMVEMADGSVLAQLGQPDMRTPIAHALAWPARMPAAVAPLDFTRLGTLTFEAPDPERFPALALARAAAESGGQAPVWLNAANEVAVEAFLGGAIRFTDIAAIIAAVLDEHSDRCRAPAPDLGAVLDADGAARRAATKLVRSRGSN